MDVAQTELPRLLAGMTVQGACAAVPTDLPNFCSQDNIVAPRLPKDHKLRPDDVIAASQKLSVCGRPSVF